MQMFSLIDIFLCFLPKYLFDWWHVRRVCRGVLPSLKILRAARRRSPDTFNYYISQLFYPLNFAKNKLFADPNRIVILDNFYKLRLTMEPASESEMLDMDLYEPAKPSRTQGKACR
jgi:hypothetical protein